jgi:hypothetical protein
MNPDTLSPPDEGVKAQPAPKVSRDELPSGISRDPTITPAEKILLLVIAGHAWGDRDEAWPSNKTLAAAVGRHPDQIRKVIRRLEAKGLIARRSGDNRTGRTFFLPWKTPDGRWAGPADPVTMPYQKYLLTRGWAKKRRQALKRAGRRCQVCNAGSGLDVHHRTYERRGAELPGDLTVLCRACHDVFHKNGQLAVLPAIEGEGGAS